MPVSHPSQAMDGVTHWLGFVGWQQRPICFWDDAKRADGFSFWAVEVGFDLCDGVEALGDQVGVGDFDVELFFEAGDEVGEGEGVESAGVEEGLVGGGVVGDVSDCVNDFEDACLGTHGFTCLV